MWNFRAESNFCTDACAGYNPKKARGNLHFTVLGLKIIMFCLLYEGKVEHYKKWTRFDHLLAILLRFTPLDRIKI